MMRPLFVIHPPRLVQVCSSLHAERVGVTLAVVLIHQDRGKPRPYK